MLCRAKSTSPLFQSRRRVLVIRTTERVGPNAWVSSVYVWRVTWQKRCSGQSGSERLRLRDPSLTKRRQIFFLIVTTKQLVTRRSENAKLEDKPDPAPACGRSRYGISIASLAGYELAHAAKAAAVAPARPRRSTITVSRQSSRLTAPWKRWQRGLLPLS